MKHKVQESLNNLKEYDDGYSSLELQLAENIDCYDIEPTYEHQEEINNIQDLINCQLTVEELNTIFYAIGYASHKLNIDKCVVILDKLQKQKEMWVSDDETN